MPRGPRQKTGQRRGVPATAIAVALLMFASQATADQASADQVVTDQAVTDLLVSLPSIATVTAQHAITQHAIAWNPQAPDKNALARLTGLMSQEMRQKPICATPRLTAERVLERAPKRTAQDAAAKTSAASVKVADASSSHSGAAPRLISLASLPAPSPSPPYPSPGALFSGLVPPDPTSSKLVSWASPSLEPTREAAVTATAAAIGAVNTAMSATSGAGMSMAARSRMSRLFATHPTRLPNDDDLACMAIAIYHEARDQPEPGRLAVASVIMNRKAAARFPETICGVVKQKAQFSFYNSDTGLAPKILEDDAWLQSIKDAALAMTQDPLRGLGGADHYHALYVDPNWSQSMNVVGTIAQHRFYRE